MSLTFEHPSWLLLLCALGAGSLAWYMYRKDRSNRNFPASARIALALFRFSALFLIALFLLKPLVKTIERELEPPLLIIAQDNSRSLLLGSDSSFYRNEWPAALQALQSDLGERYEVQSFRFGENLQEGIENIDYSDQLSDYSKALDGLYNRFSKRNIGAVILAGDGIYNAGSDPRYGTQSLQAPHFSIALGDTSKRRDLRILEVGYNKIAYLGNRFPLEIVSESRKAQGERMRVSILHKGALRYSEELNIENDYLLDQRQVFLDADEAGIQKFTVRIDAIEGETSLINNVQEIYIEVIENKQKVLVAAASPHPDVAAIANAIGSNKNYEVERVLADEFSGSVEEYNLVVMHQLPASSGKGNALLRSVREQNIPFLMVLGSQSDIDYFNAMELGYELNGHRQASTSVYGSLAEGFTLFRVPERFEQTLAYLPPLEVPFGEFMSAPGVSSLIHRRVGSIETSVPLISFNRVGEQKIGLIGGEGIWRWRMMSAVRTGDHRLFDAMFSGMVQYLASKDDRRPFRVSAPQEINENDPLIISAELYNEAYEAVNDPEVEFELTNEAGERFTFAFVRTASAYRLDAGKLAPGAYSWKAACRLGGIKHEAVGSLTIRPLQLEAIRTEAQHQLLYLYAKDRGGSLFFPNELDALVDAIENSGEAVTISYERKVLSDLINLRWILFLILGFLAMEWLMRKWHGSY